jgi:integrase
VKFPKRVKFRGRRLATIYKPSKTYPAFRLAWSVNGKRHMKRFDRYGDAKTHADELVKDLYKGSQTTALSPGQARDALSALERLQGYFQATGKRMSLLAVVSDYVEEAMRLDGHTMREAVDSFLSTAVVVKRVSLHKAVEDFKASREPKTKAKPGKRPQLSAGYHYNVSMWLKEFDETFPNYVVCDLTKELLDRYMGQFGDRSPKTRNERRGTLRLFLNWCVKKDFLSRNHHLLEATGMEREEDEPQETGFYSPKELAAMLDRANKQPKAKKLDYRELVPMIAIRALSGIRLEEAARLTWEDVFRVVGHIEVSALKSKTRSRRLVTVCSALAQWLAPYKEHSGPIWTACLDHFHRAFERLLKELKIPVQRNGLRHGFATYHFALHADEGLTAKESGNSPQIVHGRYKGLATKQQAELWFAVAPELPANAIPLRRTGKKA